MCVVGHGVEKWRAERLEVLGDPLFGQRCFVCKQVGKGVGDLRLDCRAHEWDVDGHFVVVCQGSGLGTGDGDVALEVDWGALDISGVGSLGGVADQVADLHHALDLQRLGNHCLDCLWQQILWQHFVQHSFCAVVVLVEGVHFARLGGQICHVVGPVFSAGECFQNLSWWKINRYGVLATRCHRVQTTVIRVHDLSLTQVFGSIRPQLAELSDVQLLDEPLARRTTLHLGGTPLATVECLTADAAVQVITLLDAHQVPLLIVGGGSNLVIADGPVDVVAVVLSFDSISIKMSEGIVRAEAGAVWDDVVSLAVETGLGGIECLSGIPGSAGAVPVQNVGAYGVEISDVLTSVRLLDRTTGVVEWVPASSLELAYRYSNLKFTARAVVLEIELALSSDGLSAPLRYGELARRLGAVEAGERRPVGDVREMVLELRRGKGMVFDETDHDSWSAGSFFTNPIVPEAVADAVRAQFGADNVPVYPAAGEGLVKMSAAWLIQHAGFDKGFALEGSRAGLSTKHTLALTNRGDATTAELVALARHIRAGVAEAFGVVLEPEPVWVGVSI